MENRESCVVSVQFRWFWHVATVDIPELWGFILSTPSAHQMNKLLPYHNGPLNLEGVRPKVRERLLRFFVV